MGSMRAWRTSLWMPSIAQYADLPIHSGFPPYPWEIGCHGSPWGNAHNKKPANPKAQPASNRVPSPIGLPSVCHQQPDQDSNLERLVRSEA